MNPLCPKILWLSAVLLAGCTHATTAARHDQDQFAARQTVVGSNIPIKPGQLPTSPTSATAPAESVSRDAPSLYPTEPVVGRTDRGRDPGTRAVNVGAGPPGSNPVPSPTPGIP